MYKYFTDNKNQQIVISLLKEYGIKKVIASPGGTNPALILSMQLDGSFEMYSSVDERSAAYMACGLSEESGEPVVLCCTGATASRNYISALTEAYYRKLPIIVITCSRPNRMIGQLMPQVTNRSQYLGDIYVSGEQLQVIKDSDDYENCVYKVNKVLQACKRNGGGPVHMNIECATQSCNTKELPKVHKIQRINISDDFPSIPEGNTMIYIGSHKRFSDKEIKLIDSFCEIYNAAVFCDHTSGYYGKYKVLFPLIGTQIKHSFDIANANLLIDLGEVSGDYFSKDKLNGKHVWRVNEDGELRIRFNRLDYFFDMDSQKFFNYYVNQSKNHHVNNTSYYTHCISIYNDIYKSIPELPLSHIGIAHRLASMIPNNSTIHFAIMNALRSWNFFYIDNSIKTNCNVGGFGIDGCTSSLIGASLVNPDKLYFLVSGDLAFFYDLNSLGNRHIKRNLRIIMVNDGKGAEFKHFKSVDHIIGIDEYVAGSGHFGGKSQNLVKHYAQDLGFKYISASNWNDFETYLPVFLSDRISDESIVFEIFANTDDQSSAWEIISNISNPTLNEAIVSNAKNIASPKVKKFIKKILK